MSYNKSRSETIDGGNLSPVVVPKPWGEELLIAVTYGFALKRVTILPLKAFSRQMHITKSKVYYVTSGSGRLELGWDSEIIHEISVGDAAYIEPCVVHRLVAGSDGITIVEASTPEVTEAIRLEDDFGRKVHSSFPLARYLAVIGR